MRSHKYISLIIIALTAICLWPGSPLSAPQLDVRTWTDLQQIARVIADQGGPERAIPLLLRHQDDPRVLALLLDYYGRAGRSEEFVEVAAEQAAAQKFSLSVQDTYLRALHAAGMKDSLLTVAARIIGSLADSTIEASRLIGTRLMEFGMPSAALDIFQRGREAYGDRTAFGREIALSLVELDRLDPAADELLGMIASGSVGDGQIKEVAYRIDSRGEDAEKMLLGRLDKALDKAGGKAERRLRSLLMDLALSAGRERDAYRYFNTLVRQQDENQARRTAQIFIGRSVRLSLFESAISGFALADTLELVSHETAILGQAEINQRIGRYQLAEHQFVQLTESSQQQTAAMAWKKLGDLYLEHLDRPGEALECFRKLEASGKLERPDAIDAKLRIAESFIRLKKLDQAGALCRELLGMEDTDPVETSGALLLLGDVLFFGGQPDSAATVYMTFARLNLGDERSNDALGKVYLIRHDRSADGAPSRTVGQALFAARSGDIQQARDLFAGLLREQGDSLYRAEVFYQMGRMYEREKEFTLALGTYDQLVLELPKHQLAPLAELRMGIILLDEMGDTTRARSHFEKVVMEYPPGVATPQARRLLRELLDEKL